MQNSLRDSLEHLTQAYQLLGDAVVIVCLDGSVGFVNAACEKLFGYSNEELRGQQVSKIIPSGFPGRDIQSSADAIWEGRATGVRKGGAEVSINFTVSLPVGDADKVLGYIAVLRPSVESSVESPAAARTPELEGAARLQGMGLFEQRRAEEDAKRLAYEQSVLMEIGRIISSSLDIDEVYERFAAQAGKLISFDRIIISLIDHERDTLITSYAAGVKAQTWRRGAIFRLAKTIEQDIWDSRTGVIIQNQSAEDLENRYPHISDILNVGIKSFLSAPLIANDKVIGALGLRSKHPNAYTERDLTLAETIAAQIAGAVANAELHGELEREAKEREVLAEIGRIISSSLDIYEVYERFAEEVKKLVPLERISINIVDLEQNTCREVYHSGIEVSGRGPDEVVPLEGTFTEHAISGRSGFLYQGDDLSNIERQFPGAVPAYEAGFNSFISMPLISHHNAIGCLQVMSDQPNAYTQRDVELVEHVSTQIVGTVANSRLYAELEREANERAVLAEIGRIISSSLDIGQIYERFAEAARKLISFDRVLIATVDMEHQSITFTYSWGIQTATTGVGDTVSPVDFKTTHIGQVVTSQSGKIFHPASREEVERQFPYLLESYDAGIRAFLSVPLISDGLVTSLLLFRSCEPEAYDERDLLVAQQIGNQIAGAITNSVLHERVQQSQAALELRSAELARSNSDLEQFAYVASHDLQTPLRTVAGLTKILAEDYEGKLDADGDEIIRLTVSETTRMQALIKGLLEYSRLGQDVEESQYTDCQSLLAQELEDMAVAINEARATVTYDALPTVKGDSSLLGQLLRNLVSNAIKYRTDEPPMVHVSAERAGDEWIFSVSDNGIGIDPRYTERIFVIFQRLHHQSEFSGTGMGLAICKKAIVRLGGRIWVDSQPGEGATFYFTIPIPDDPTMTQYQLSERSGEQE